MRRMTLALLALTLLLAAPAQARMLGFSGSPAAYRELRGLDAVVHADFVSFGSDWRALLARDRRLRAVALLTWEPWDESLAAIADGRDDAYLRRVAGEVAAERGPVYIRFAHEMNGDWYPWAGDPTAYVAAWRHIWRVFAAAGATNARWVWAPDLFAGLPRARWRLAVAAYWPGARYVDIVGTSLVVFASGSRWSLAYRFASIDWLHRRFARPFWLAEVKVNAAQREAWLAQLRGELRPRQWISALIWSQTPSRAQASGAPTGQMDWSLGADPLAQRLLRAAVDAGT